MPISMATDQGKTQKLSRAVDGPTVDCHTGQPDWEQCTFDYRCGEWKVTRHFVAVRRKQLKEPSPQADLLDTSEYDYDYFCYVTTESFTPWQTHKKYGERATCETWIEESKGQMGMGKIRTAEFLANAALFHCRYWLTIRCGGWLS